jgi:hypothetical protein
MCVLAPATLIDSRIEWTPIDAHSAAATFTNASHIVRATLLFNDAGELIDFHSGDRYRASADGKNFERVHWSTPLSGYRTLPCGRLAARGEARWRDANSDFAYIELTFDDVRYNVFTRPVAGASL